MATPAKGAEILAFSVGCGDDDGAGRAAKGLAGCGNLACPVLELGIIPWNISVAFEGFPLEAVALTGAEEPNKG